MDEAKIKEIVRRELAQILGQDKYIFTRDMQIMDGRDVQLAKGTGTRVGTQSTQKLGFLGATPIVRQAAITHPNVNGGTYNQTDVESMRSAVESIMDVLRNFGLTA